jgi:AAA15 family ATPase/GTPase
MLLSFGARNYLSFLEGFDISLELNASCPVSISKGEEITNAICIIGANASGKTNVIRALSFIAEFCCNSFDTKPEEDIPIVSFGSNSDPTSFFMEFSVEGIRYFYEVELTQKGILKETLERKSLRKTKVFSRHENEIEYVVKDLKELEKIKMRKNASTISIAHQHEIMGLEVIYTFFTSIVSNIDPYFGEVKYNGLTANVFAISKKYMESEEMLTFTKEKLSTFDTGINGIKLKKLKGPTGDDVYFPFFSHQAKNGNVTIPFYLESNGTKSLFSQLSLYKQILDCGGVLLIDEFDYNLHPDILDALVELFLDPEINTHKAQIIFSSHNTTIMDKLGKYRIVLVNKEDNESFLYRLDELPGDLVRNDRSIEHIYKTGKLGGTPRL